MAAQGQENQWKSQLGWTGGRVPDQRHGRNALSRWSRSRTKRWFDVAMVLAALPIAAPVFLLIAIVAYIGSPGPVFFLQTRKGLHGRLFSIVKFRTMVHPGPPANSSITTADDDHITGVGRILRHWKLDELPQLFNVLRGDMSLVGPRPRVPEQAGARIECRPGMTGAASLAFAREEVLLAGIPRNHLDSYYSNKVIPIKQSLDDTYMAHATFFSDIRLLLLTFFRIWMVNDLRMFNALSEEKSGKIGIIHRRR